MRYSTNQEIIVSSLIFWQCKLVFKEKYIPHCTCVLVPILLAFLHRKISFQDMWLSENAGLSHIFWATRPLNMNWHHCRKTVVHNFCSEIISSKGSSKDFIIKQISTIPKNDGINFGSTLYSANSQNKKNGTNLGER